MQNLLHQGGRKKQWINERKEEWIRGTLKQEWVVRSSGTDSQFFLVWWAHHRSMHQPCRYWRRDASPARHDGKHLSRAWPNSLVRNGQGDNWTGRILVYPSICQVFSELIFIISISKTHSLYFRSVHILWYLSNLNLSEGSMGLSAAKLESAKEIRTFNYTGLVVSTIIEIQSSKIK
jgi:hypothetical protein